MTISIEKILWVVVVAGLVTGVGFGLTGSLREKGGNIITDMGSVQSGGAMVDSTTTGAHGAAGTGAGTGMITDPNWSN